MQLQKVEKPAGAFEHMRRGLAVGVSPVRIGREREALCSSFQDHHHQTMALETIVKGAKKKCTVYSRRPPSSVAYSQSSVKGR